MSARDYNVIIKRFGLDGQQALSLAEVADEYSVTRARVHQIEKKLLNMMREIAPSDPHLSASLNKVRITGYYNVILEESIMKPTDPINA